MSETKFNPNEYKRLLYERAEGLKRFAEWEKKQINKMSTTQALAVVGVIFDMMSPESRKKDLDAKVKGIIAMRKALALLNMRKE
ncbi:hypothetical protein GF338_06185 [candidate division WOR-3 bacterium]|nr:hypothetical protein [candidate division WOR-3 bacterium]